MFRSNRLQLLCFLFLSLSLLGFSASPTFTIKTIAAPGVNGQIVTADFDNDGNPDFAVGTSKGLSVFFGDGGGNFMQLNMAGATGTLQIADVDGDGRPDLVAVSAPPSGSQSIVSYRNNGDRTFIARDSGTIANWHGIAFAAGDYDGDGKADLALSTSQLTVEVLLGNGDGTFQSPHTVYTATVPDGLTDPASYGITSVQVAGDFDGNGKLDFVVGEGPLSFFGGENIGFLLNQGGLTFTRQGFSEGQFGGGAVALDANGDGKTDVGFGWTACHTPCGGGDVWSLGSGAPAMIDSATWDGTIQGLPQSPVAADFNGDGVKDTAWSYGTYAPDFNDPAERQSVLVHLGPLSPTAQQQTSIEYKVGPDDQNRLDAMATADFNNDGAPDIVVISGANNAIRLMLNTTVGVVKPGFRFSVGPATQSVAAGQSATFNATLTPTGGFTQAVAFTCSGLPTGAACSFTPSSLVPSNGPANTTLSISTTARTSSSLHGGALGRSVSATFFAFTLPFFGVVCLGGTGVVGEGRGRPNWKRLLLLATLCAVIAFTLIGCGGFSGSAKATPPPANPGGGTTAPSGTPAGTYTVVVTAQGVGLTHSANINLVVQ